MDLMVLNKSFETVAILDSLISTLWTDRYTGYGDFEIYTPVSSSLMAVLFNKGYYLINPKSEHVMIIEHSEISTDVEDGSKIITKGRSLGPDYSYRKSSKWNSAASQRRYHQSIRF